MLYKLFTLASLAININGEMYDYAVKKAVSVIVPNEKSLPKNAPDMVTGTLTLEINSIPVCEDVTRWYNSPEVDVEMSIEMCGSQIGSTGYWYCESRFEADGCLPPGSNTEPNNCPDCRSGYIYDSNRYQCCNKYPVMNSYETRIFGKITGLKSNKKGASGIYGFHIHEFGDISSDEPGMIDCLSTKLHYNPFGKSHGGPDSDERHVGDLGNIKPDQYGVAIIDITDQMIKLNGKTSVVGRSFVIHELEDDLQPTSETGNAGGRLACGTIGIAESSPQPTPAPTEYTKSPTKYTNEPTALPTKSPIKYTNEPTNAPTKHTSKGSQQQTQQQQQIQQIRRLVYQQQQQQQQQQQTQQDNTPPKTKTGNEPTASPIKYTNEPTLEPTASPIKSPGKCYTVYDNPCATIHGKDVDYAYFPSCTSCCHFIQCGPNGAATDHMCAQGTFWNPTTPQTPNSNGCDSFNRGECTDFNAGCKLYS